MVNKRRITNNKRKSTNRIKIENEKMCVKVKRILLCQKLKKQSKERKGKIKKKNYVYIWIHFLKENYVYFWIHILLYIFKIGYFYIR